jgi:hypothetical protein
MDLAGFLDSAQAELSHETLVSTCKIFVSIITKNIAIRTYKLLSEMLLFLILTFTEYCTMWGMQYFQDFCSEDVYR